MLQLEQLKRKWLLDAVDANQLVEVKDLHEFEKANNICLPNDLKEYFMLLNGTKGEYTDELYEFYSLDRIKKVAEEFRDWEGIPDYQSILNLSEVKGLFVFANFSFNLFAYAIKLHSETSNKNEVYVLCGSEHKMIANSFSEFIELYLNDSIELQLNN